MDNKGKLFQNFSKYSCEIAAEENCVTVKSTDIKNYFRIVSYEIFPGIYISFNKIRCEFLPAQFEYPVNMVTSEELIINYCIKGQCEVLLSDNTFVHQKSSEFSVTNYSTKNGHTYPNKYYDGLEFFIDTAKLNIDFLKNFNIDFELLSKKMLFNKSFFISTYSISLERFIFKMWKLAYEIENIFELRVLSINLLYALCHVEFPKIKYTSLTNAQNNIAKETCKIVTKDIEKNFSARELATCFNISETSLKNYFKAVYGDSIFMYVKKTRLNRAADMLKNTKLSVNEIANTVGYSSQSKFSAAFKEHFMATPLEYRKQNNLKSLTDI